MGGMDDELEPGSIAGEQRGKNMKFNVYCVLICLFCGVKSMHACLLWWCPQAKVGDMVRC